MSFINHSTKMAILKIVYAGPGMSGKTTNIQFIHDNYNQDPQSKIFLGGAENERSLLFDFFPFAVGDMRGYQTRLHLMVIPGQTLYEIPQQFMLRGLDGIVFVADSEPERMESNIQSFENLEKNLEKHGYDIQKIPLVFQYNKRDLANPTPIRELENTLNPMRRPYFEAVASQGKGVMETFESISTWVIKEIKGGASP